MSILRNHETLNSSSEQIFILCQPFTDVIFTYQHFNLSAFCLAANGSVLYDEKKFIQFSREIQSLSSSPESNSSMQCDCSANRTVPSSKPFNQVGINCGGSGLNTARALNCLAKGSVRFFGIIGDDSLSSFIVEHLSKIELDCSLHTVLDGCTASCVVLIENESKSRSMVSTLGCSMQFPERFIKKGFFDGCAIFYLCGYMLDATEELLADLLVELHEKSGVLFVFNLSAPFCVKNRARRDVLVKILQRADIVLCNEEEALAFYIEFLCDSLDKHFPNSSVVTQDIVLQLAKFKSKIASGRTTVVTRGSNSTLVLHDGLFADVPLSSKYPNLPVVDTTGGGDCFAAGFMNEILSSKGFSDKLDILRCIEKGHEFAEFIVKRLGISFD